MSSAAGEINDVLEAWNLFVPAGQPVVSQTNWTGLTFQASRYFCISMASTGAQNATITFNITLSAGTWSLAVFHQAAADRGIYDVKIDGVSVGTVDGYAASGTPTRTTLTGIVVAKGGLHTLTFTMSTKNGTSSNYTGDLNGMSFVRTA